MEVKLVIALDPATLAVFEALAKSLAPAAARAATQTVPASPDPAAKPAPEVIEAKKPRAKKADAAAAAVVEAVNNTVDAAFKADAAAVPAPGHNAMACLDCGKTLTKENSSTTPTGRVVHIGCVPATGNVEAALTPKVEDKPSPKVNLVEVKDGETIDAAASRVASEKAKPTEGKKPEAPKADREAARLAILALVKRHGREAGVAVLARFDAKNLNAVEEAQLGAVISAANDYKPAAAKPADDDLIG